MVPPRFREIGLGLSMAIALVGCAGLPSSPLSEGCRQGGAYWSECRRYAIVERWNVFRIQRDGEAELAYSFPTRVATETALLHCYLRADGCPLDHKPDWISIPIPEAPTAVSASPLAPSTYIPLVDTAMIRDHDKFTRDLNECRDLAITHTASGQALSSGLEGAAAGAAFGALMSLAVGVKPGQLASAGALGGGVGGLGTGTVNQEATYQQIYKNCMIGRGWPVLR